MLVLEGRRIAFGASRKRKVRTPKGAMPRNPSPFDWDTRGRRVERLSDGQCHRKLYRRSPFDAVRVKRWRKRPPREAQATRHGKPHRVQGQIGNPGAARSSSAKADGFRVSAAQTNDSLRRKAQTEFGLQPFQNHSPIPDLRMTIYDLRILRKFEQLRRILCLCGKERGRLVRVL